MTSISRKQLAILLSMYVDNELSAQEKLRVEELLQSNPSARKQLNDLLTIKHALESQEPLPPNEDFYAQLYKKLPQPTYIRQRDALIPKRFVPAIAGVTGLTMAVVVLFVSLYSDFFYNYFSATKQNVQQAYEETVVNKWIMPLFKQTNKDEALQFAMFGVLPLDDSSNTVLKVDNTLDSVYAFEFEQGNNAHFEPVTVEELYNEIQPSEEQRRTLDTIFTLASKKIEEGVLLDESQNLAIAPSVIDLQRSIVAKAAASLDVKRRERMENFFQKRNASYAIVVNTTPPVSKTKLVKQLSDKAGNKTYVMISQDTVVLYELAFDVNDVRKKMAKLKDRSSEMEFESQQLARRVLETSKRVAQTSRRVAETSRRITETTHNVATPPIGYTTPVSVSGSKYGVRVQVVHNRRNAPHGFVASYVQPRKREPRRKDRVEWIVPKQQAVRAFKEAHILETHNRQHLRFDSIFSAKENLIRELELSLEHIGGNNNDQIFFNETTIRLQLDSIGVVLQHYLTDSVFYKYLHPLQPLQPLLPETQIKTAPPGVEIRPDYYEVEHQNDPESPTYLINHYRQQLEKYKQKIKRIRERNPRSSTKAPARTIEIEVQSNTERR